jgi:hypothetical protein
VGAPAPARARRAPGACGSARIAGSSQVAIWRTLLTTSVDDGRSLLREVLAGPLMFTPTDEGYRFQARVVMGDADCGCYGGPVPNWVRPHRDLLPTEYPSTGSFAPPEEFSHRQRLGLCHRDRAGGARRCSPPGRKSPLRQFLLHRNSECSVSTTNATVAMTPEIREVIVRSLGRALAEAYRRREHRRDRVDQLDEDPGRKKGKGVGARCHELPLT